MREDLIRQFLEVFQNDYEICADSSLSRQCLYWMEDTYSDRPIDFDGEKYYYWQAYYDKEEDFIKDIVADFDNVREIVGGYNLHKIVQDVADNLYELRTPEEKNSYLIGLLLPFEYFTSEDGYGRYEKYVDEATRANNKRDTIEYCLCIIHLWVEYFAKSLDIELIKQGIDLFELQEKCHVYLIKERDLGFVYRYFGGKERAEMLLSRLPKRQGGRPQPELDKRQEVLARIEPYCNKAIERGYMEKTVSGYKWTFGGKSGKVRLGYFIDKIYKLTESIPYQQVESLFGVSRLDASIHQCRGAKNANNTNNTNASKIAQKLQSWKDDIDRLFD